MQYSCKTHLIYINQLVIKNQAISISPFVNFLYINRNTIDDLMPTLMSTHLLKVGTELATAVILSIQSADYVQSSEVTSKWLQSRAARDQGAFSWLKPIPVRIFHRAI